MKTFKFFKPGDRVFDTHYKQIGIVFMADSDCIQVAFPLNISGHAGGIYKRAYEQKFLISNSRLRMVTLAGRIVSMEEFFDVEFDGKKAWDQLSPDDKWDRIIKAVESVIDDPAYRKDSF